MRTIRWISVCHLVDQILHEFEAVEFLEENRSKYIGPSNLITYLNELNAY